jgi:hypothetical protein
VIDTLDTLTLDGYRHRLEHRPGPSGSVVTGRMIEVDGVAMHISPRGRSGSSATRATTVELVDASANCSTIEPFDVGRDRTDRTRDVFTFYEE